MNLFQLMIKTVAALGLLYGYYYCFLRNRSFHRYNRFFLLTIAVAATASPFVVIPLQLAPAGATETTLAKTLQVISAAGWHEQEDGGTAVIRHTRRLSWQQGVMLLYIAGLVLTLAVFMRSLFYILRLRRQYRAGPVSGIRLYTTTEPAAPFSFFRHVFWHRDIPFDTKEGQQVFRHELYHVQQGHSADVILLELLCCIGWFNPFFHLVKKELKVLHEFLADEHTAGRHDRFDYARLLVVQALQRKNAGPSLSHPFSYHPIKRRIMMLTTKHSLHRQRGYLSRAMVLPLLLLLLSAFALRPVHHPAMAMAVAAAAPIAVIIDAGHGGIDAGAVVDHVNEKDIALSLAQKVKALAPQYNVRVIMTRETDELPGGATNIQAGLRKRTEIANQAGAAMFISLHVNQSDGLPQPAGFDAYIAAGKEDKKNQLLASTLLQQLGSVYTVAPDIKKRSEKSIWVLEQNPRPAVLLECGNLSIPADKEFITNEKNQENVAKMILRGIVNYSKL